MGGGSKEPRKRKVLSEDAKQKEREKNKLNARSRINIGSAFTLWCEIKDEEGCPTDAEFVM